MRKRRPSWPRSQPGSMPSSVANGSLRTSRCGSGAASACQRTASSGNSRAKRSSNATAVSVPVLGPVSGATLTPPRLRRATGRVCKVKLPANVSVVIADPPVPRAVCLIRSSRSIPVTLNTIALELVAPNVERGREQALEEAHKVLRCSAEAGLEGRIRHVMIPGMIEEDDDRPIEMKPKMDVLDFWTTIRPELSGVNGLCTQVTAFMDKQALRQR